MSGQSLNSPSCPQVLQTLAPATSLHLPRLGSPSVLFLLCFQVFGKAEPLPLTPSQPFHLARSYSSFRSETLFPLGSPSLTPGLSQELPYAPTTPPSHLPVPYHA